MAGFQTNSETTNHQGTDTSMSLSVYHLDLEEANYDDELHQGDRDSATNDPEDPSSIPEVAVDNDGDADQLHQLERHHPTSPPCYILPCIVYSQFAGTALWFAANAVLSDLIDERGLEDDNNAALAILTSAVQAGIILGTLLSALTNVTDRYPPTRVFLVSCLLGAALNALIPTPVAQGLAGLTALRLLTGMCLAGIYPVGMKISADWYAEGLGVALGFLVGASVLGTALPFLLRQIPHQPWQFLLWETSILATSGGLLLGLCVAEGPRRRANPTKKQFDHSVVVSLFRVPDFRAAAFGYFGHIYEMYAFWAWCPVVWQNYLEGIGSSWDASVVTFAVISAGAIGCVVGGFLSPLFGSARVGVVALTISGLQCFFSPLFFLLPQEAMLFFYLLWGVMVAMDSPQFSRLVAQTTPAENKGTALTIVNCIAFAITIGSIYLLQVPVDPQYLFLLLAPGPVFGVWSMRQHIFSDGGRKREVSHDGEGVVEPQSVG